MKKKKNAPPAIDWPVYGVGSEEFKPHLKKMIMIVLVGFIIMTVIIFGVLSLYWAVLFRQYPSAITIAVVDFDGSANIGQVAEQTFQAQLETNPMSLGYKLFNNITGRQRFPGGNADIIDAVIDEQFWGAIIINENATTLLEEAYSIGNATYDPNGAVFLVYNEARAFTTTDEYLVPELLPLLRTLTAQMNVRLANQFLARVAADTTGNLVANAEIAPQIVGSPIGFSIFNVRPFDNYPAFSAIQIGLIYLIILTFEVILLTQPIHVVALYLKKRTYIIYRILLPIGLYFLFSLFYSFVSLMFGVPFDRRYGQAGFVLYWMVNFATMLASGLIIENFNNLVGQPLLSPFLVFWIVTNVSTSFFSIHLSAGFYQFGYAWPFSHTVSAAKAIIFNTKSYMGENFGVLIAWVFVNVVILPFSIQVHRKKLLKQEAKQRQHVKDLEKEERENKAKKERSV